MDLGAMRSWLKRNNEICMITERVYRTLVDEAETDAVEFRLVMPRGDMDYTASILIPEAIVKADREASLKKAFDRLLWETTRDTRITFDPAHALENGVRYQHGE